MNGGKSSTRRIIKPEHNVQRILGIPLWERSKEKRSVVGGRTVYWFDVIEDNGRQKPFRTCCGFRSTYEVGDILWVRETFKTIDGITYYKCGSGKNTKDLVSKNGGWKASIHMPLKVARYFLKVTNIYPQRLQDITIEDVQKEGFPISEALNDPMYEGTDLRKKVEISVRRDFSIRWNRTISKNNRDKYCWDSNPWVWVIEFEDITEQFFKKSINKNKRVAIKSLEIV